VRKIIRILIGSMAFTGWGAADAGPVGIVDAHNHIQPGVGADLIVSALDDAGVGKIVLMPNGGKFAERARLVLDAHARYPERVIPFIGLNGIRDFHPGLLNQIDRLLAGGKFRGMGEVLARHYGFEVQARSGRAGVSAGDFTLPADSPGVDALLKLAAKHGVVVVVHMETTAQTVPALERALARNPETRVIWAHQTHLKTVDGSTEAHSHAADPGELAAMLDRFPNLYADIAAGYETKFLRPGDGKLPGAWKDLYETYSDRFVIGCDIPFASRWKEGLYAKRMALVRTWLEQLSPQARENIAHANIERLVTPR
jgi:predicted TIM-barrel fold metal-dependent hydrolase